MDDARDFRSLATLLREVALVRLDPDGLGNLDPAVVRLCQPVARELTRRYFRSTVTGLDHFPPGPALIVGNHNAGITFLEPFAMGAEWYELRGIGDPIYFAAHDAMVALPFVGNLLLRLGAVRADLGNARRVLGAGRKLLVFPGGNHEGFRPFRERYTVDFGGHLGFARLGVELDVPVVPVANVGGHHSFIVLHRGERLARLLGTDRLLRSKAFPVALALPWGLSMGPWFHLPPPVKFDIEIGAPIRPSQALAHVAPAGRARALYDLVTGRIQTMMDGIAARRRRSVA